MSIYSSKYLASLLLLVTSLACLKVNAVCELKRSDGVIVDALEVKLPITAFQPFDPNVPDGTVLYTSPGTGVGLGGRATCTTPVGIVRNSGIGPVGQFSTYPTTVAGIGIRIKGAINPDQWWPQERNWPDSYAYNLDPGSSFTFELVKTGPITAAGTLSGLIGTTTAVNHGSYFRRLEISGSLAIRPQVPTCKVLTPNISVNLGKISIGSMRSVGTTSPSFPLEIRLQCSGGNAGTTTKMFTTLTDANTPGNRSGTLSLASNSTVSGVGIQILRSDGTAVSYGPDSAETGNPNQWKVGEFGNTMVTIPLKAHYIQTSTNVRAGKAEGAATFTMSYQ